MIAVRDSFRECPRLHRTFPSIAFAPPFAYREPMSALALNLEKEFEAIDPEDALHIQRAVVEMLQMARRKKVAAKQTPDKPVKYTLPSWSLGARPGLDLTKLAHVADDLSP